MENKVTSRGNSGEWGRNDDRDQGLGANRDEGPSHQPSVVIAGTTNSGFDNKVLPYYYQQ